jgi:NAD(P)-dependent dehydrogenase (short-subunit alcohol dehydrogenase family)
VAWKANDIPDLTGRVAVVTGGNGGLGRETARQLAVHGAHVVIAARNLTKADEACRSIRATAPNAGLEVRQLDLGSLASIADFAAATRATHPAIQMLFNNAGVMAVPEGKTADGFEIQFGTNVLGHFALTMGLLPSLLAGAPSRVVFTSSLARTRAGRYDLDNPHMRGCYKEWDAYGMSKRADLQLAMELDRRLRDRGVSGFAADPGFSRTDLQGASLRANAGPSQWFWRIAVAVSGQPASWGALPQLRAGTDPAAAGGTMYRPRLVTIGRPALHKVEKDIDRPEQMSKLWEICECETGLKLQDVLAGR